MTDEEKRLYGANWYQLNKERLKPIRKSYRDNFKKTYQ